MSLHIQPVATASARQRVCIVDFNRKIIETRAPPTHVQHPEDCDTMIVLDWDDTLLCSSFLSGCGLRLDSSAALVQIHKEDLDPVCESARALIEECLKHGRVCIVTNAETGWVQLSCSKFFPSLVPLLSKVYVMSARTAFGFSSTHNKDDEIMAADQCLWKYLSMVELVETLFKKATFRQIMSLGDSISEQNACMALAPQYPDVCIKTIKFLERSSPSQLKQQLDAVTRHFPIFAKGTQKSNLQLSINKPRTTLAPQEQKNNRQEQVPKSSKPIPIPHL